jgi:hypothetical protein
MTIHYSPKGQRAHCGANQNQKMRHRVAVTNERERVTCKKCRHYIDSGALDAFEAFRQELLQKLGLANG